MGLLIQLALKVALLEARNGSDPWKPITTKVLDAITRAWMIEAVKFMAESGIDLSHDVSLQTH
jgi:hypothetical protein